MTGESIQTELENVQQKCPAFEGGCPYAKTELVQLVPNANQCPEFKGSCPFKDSRSLADVYEKITKAPNATLNESHEKGLVELINSIHSISRKLSDNIGECPVFSTESGCPFKSMCTDGTPLLQNLEAFSWSKVLDDSLQDIVHDIALSKEFKAGTKKVHREAERVHFVRSFLKGNVDEKLYRAFVASLYFIYEALEKESKRCAGDAMFKQIHFPAQLNRVESLEKDLEYFYGDEWREEITMSDVVSEYVDHIHKIADKDPALMISHHYTRYLGDLSGGQVLKKAAMKACNLPPTGEGVEFYEFRQIESARDFKNMYRKQLDTINVTKTKADELVEEAKIAFMFNIKLFKELDILGGFVEDIVLEEDTPISSSKPDVCPFLPKKTGGANSKGDVVQSSPATGGRCPVTAVKQNATQIVVILSVLALAIILKICL